MARNDPFVAPVGRVLAGWPLRTDHRHSWVIAGISMVTLWLERSRSRRVLATLDAHRLRDIGVSRGDARRESAKPFWKA